MLTASDFKDSAEFEATVRFRSHALTQKTYPVPTV